VQETTAGVVLQALAPMFQVASSVPVYLDILEMDSTAQVSRIQIQIYTIVQVGGTQILFVLSQLIYRYSIASQLTKNTEIGNMFAFYRVCTSSTNYNFNNYDSKISNFVGRRRYMH